MNNAANILANVNLAKPNEQFFLNRILEGKLFIYRDGRAYNVERQRFYVTRHENSRYHHLFIMVDRKTHQCLLHRLLYLIYVGDIPEGYDVYFKDGNTLNIEINNLGVRTPQETKIAGGLKAYNKTGRTPRPNTLLTDETVIALREEFNRKPFLVRPRARELGVSHATLLSALRGKTFKHLDNAISQDIKLRADGPTIEEKRAKKAERMRNYRASKRKDSPQRPIIRSNILPQPPKPKPSAAPKPRVIKEFDFKPFLAHHTFMVLEWDAEDCAKLLECNTKELFKLAFNYNEGNYRKHKLQFVQTNNAEAVKRFGL